MSKKNAQDAQDVTKVQAPAPGEAESTTGVETAAEETNEVLPPKVAEKPLKLSELRPEQIDELGAEQVMRLCRENQVPASVPVATARRQLKAVLMGGREKFVPGGYTLCPFDGHLAAVEQTISVTPPSRWMRCTGPRRCRFKR